MPLSFGDSKEAYLHRSKRRGPIELAPLVLLHSPGVAGVVGQVMMMIQW